MCALRKGGDAGKANNIAPGNKDSFWLLEWVKFVGAKEAALPMVVSGTKDRKTYLPVPVEMNLDTHRNIIREMRKDFYAKSAVKMDVLATLTYLQIFLTQWKAGNNNYLNKADFSPTKFATGLEVAYYKDMGSALALLNLTRLNFPDWMRVEQGNSADAYLAMLQEHRSIVQNLDESHSDEYRLLQLYREFLSGRNLDAFYDFTAGYAHLLMTRLDRNQPAFQFSTQNLEVLIMANRNSEADLDLLAIVQSLGFRNLATAIRLATIIPQRQKAKREPRLYDVRYGLADELKRKSLDKHELAQALSEFVQSYNQETMQILERNGQQRRKLVTIQDLDQVLAFMTDEDTAYTVGSLLIAYGYSRDGSRDQSYEKALFGREQSGTSYSRDGSRDQSYEVETSANQGADNIELDTEGADEEKSGDEDMGQIMGNLGDDE